MATPRIELVDLRKSFGDNHVLGGVSLRVLPGESLVIIGGSGTGKSVTLKCMLGILKPDGGQVLIDGVPDDRADRAAFLSDFGMLFQGGALFDSLTVWQNVAFRLRQGPTRLSRAAARTRAIDKLARVGLGPETADLYPAEISGGMQKRVGLARAIAADNADALAGVDGEGDAVEQLLGPTAQGQVFQLNHELRPESVERGEEDTGARLASGQRGRTENTPAGWASASRAAPA